MPAIISGTGKATDFKFCTHFNTINCNKSPFNSFVKNSSGHSQELAKFFRASIYRAHRAVIFAIARLSCSPFGAAANGATTTTIICTAADFSLTGNLLEILQSLGLKSYLDMLRKHILCDLQASRSPLFVSSENRQELS